jgi:hypothetical protein
MIRVGILGVLAFTFCTGSVLAKGVEKKLQLSVTVDEVKSRTFIKDGKTFEVKPGQDINAFGASSTISVHVKKPTIAYSQNGEGHIKGVSK